MTTTLAPRRPSRVRTIWRGFWLIVLIALVLVHVVGGWYYSGEIREGAFQVVAGETQSPPDLGQLRPEPVEFETPLGPMDAWVTPGTRSEWVIHVHGKGADPGQAEPLMNALVGAGYHQMVITYRNDPGQPADPSGFYQYGRTEWEDLSGAVDYAYDAGASTVMLVGYSTGASISTAYIYRHGPEKVSAAVFDSPNLDMTETIDYAAEDRRILGLPIPSTVTATARFLAALRLGLNWNALDYVKRAGQLTVPTLIIHGTEDDTVPIDTSREMAEARPEFVTLLEFPGAGHVKSWETDPPRYEASVRGFLARAGT